MFDNNIDKLAEETKTEHTRQGKNISQRQNIEHGEDSSIRDELHSGNNECLNGEEDEFKGRYSYFDFIIDINRPYFEVKKSFFEEDEFKTTVEKKKKKTYWINSEEVCKFRPLEPKRVRRIYKMV